MNSLFNYSLEHMLEVGVLTGSRAFNCSTNESDWDIVITQSMLPNLNSCNVISSTNFLKDSWTTHPYRTHKKAGYLIDEEAFPELNEYFIEYDQHTIWGSLIHIIKYLDDSENIINLFVYEDRYSFILDSFKQLNSMITFVYGASLQDKSVRIKAFTELCAKLGITNT